MSFGERIRRFLASRKRYRLWRRIVSGMGIVVVFITTYMLILPAITMERPTYCGIEEHTHKQECYLSCSESENMTPPEFSCADLENYVHTHNSDCYFNGELVCPLEERANHVHTADCFVEEKTLVCDLEETEGHTHDDSCYSEVPTLVCENTDPDHEHDDSCYEMFEELTCTLEESEGHTHDDSCYEITRTIDCPETAHIHGAECYDENGSLICPLAEAEEHVHSDSCMTKSVSEEHKHTEACYGTEPMCGHEEHKHTDECYVNPDEETTGGNGGGSSENDEPSDDDDYQFSDDELLFDTVVSPDALMGPELMDLAQDGEPKDPDGNPEEFKAENVKLYKRTGGTDDNPEYTEYDPTAESGEYEGFTLVAEITRSDSEAISEDTKNAIMNKLGITDKDFYNDDGLLIGEIYYKSADGSEKKPLPEGVKVELFLNVQGAAGERYLQVLSLDEAETEASLLTSNIDTLEGTLDPEWYDMIKKFYFIAPPKENNVTKYCFISTKVFGGYVQGITYNTENGQQAIIDGTASTFDKVSAEINADTGDVKSVLEDEKAGHDDATNNYIVRTFDNIQYNLAFNLSNRGLTTPAHVEPLRIEFSQKKDISQAVFNMNDMSWIQNWRIDYYDELPDENGNPQGNLVAYETSAGKFRLANPGYDKQEFADGYVKDKNQYTAGKLDLAYWEDDVKETVDGKTYVKTDYNEIIRAHQKTTPKGNLDSSYDSGIRYQVLTGTTVVTLPGVQNRTAGIRVLASANNARIAPVFNAYFAGNPLNLNNEVNNAASDQMQDIFQEPEPYKAALDTSATALPTDTGRTAASTVTVTAAPRYKFNIQSNDNLNYRANFDLETGKETPKANENSVYGRMVGYGITLTLNNKTDNRNSGYGIMGEELPTDDITLNFNVESKTSSGSFSTLSLEGGLPIMRLNSAVSDTMFSEIILNDGSDKITVLNNNGNEDIPLGFNENGSAIVLDNSEDGNESSAADDTEYYEETAPADYSRDIDGDTAPSDSEESAPAEESSDNAFISSDDNEDTYFEKVASDNTEYMAGVSESISDYIYEALFDEGIMTIAETDPQTNPTTFVKYTETDTSRTWDFTGVGSLGNNYPLTADGIDTFGIKLESGTVTLKKSEKVLSIGTGASVTIPLPENVSEATLIISATAYNRRFFNVGSQSKLEIADTNTFTLTSADITNNSVKVEVDSSSNGEAKVSKIELTYTTDGGGDVEPDPDKDKIGTHSGSTGSDETWKFNSGMPESNDVELTNGRDINGIKYVKGSGTSYLKKSNGGLALAATDGLSVPISIASDKAAKITVVTNPSSDVTKLSVGDNALASDGTYSVTSGETIELKATANVNIVSIAVTYVNEVGPQPSDSNIVDANVMYFNTPPTITDKKSDFPVTFQNVSASGTFSMGNPGNSGSPAPAALNIEGLATFTFSKRSKDFNDTGTSGNNTEFNATFTVPTTKGAVSSKLYVYTTAQSSNLTLSDTSDKLRYNNTNNQSEKDTTNHYYLITYEGLKPGNSYQLKLNNTNKVKLAGLILVNYTDELDQSDWVSDVKPAGPVGAYIYYVNTTPTYNKVSGINYTNQKFKEKGFFIQDGISGVTDTYGKSITYKDIEGFDSSGVTFKYRTGNMNSYPISFTVPSENGEKSAKLYIAGRNSTNQDTGNDSTTVKLINTSTSQEHITPLTWNNGDDYNTFPMKSFGDLVAGETYTIQMSGGFNLEGIILVTSTAEPDPDSWIASSEVPTESTTEGSVEDTTIENMGTHWKNDKEEGWEWKENIRTDGNTTIKDGSNINGLLMSGSGTKSRIHASKYLLLGVNNPLQIPVRKGANVLTIIRLNNRTLTLNGGAAEFTTSDANDTYIDTYTVSAADITAGYVTIEAPSSGQVNIDKITVSYKSSGKGTYTAPTTDNKYVATWGFDANGAPLDGSMTLGVDTDFNGIKYKAGEGSTGSTYDTDGKLTIAAGDSLVIPVNKKSEKYTDAKLTVTTESGSFTVGDSAVIGEDGYIYNITGDSDTITITANGRDAVLTGISLDYDRYDGVNYGDFASASNTWNFNKDMPDYEPKLKDYPTLEGSMKFVAGTTGGSYFGKNSVHLAAGDKLIVPIDKTKSGGIINISHDGALVNTVAMENNSIPFSTKGTMDTYTITAGESGVDISSIAIQYDAYKEGVNYGKYTETTVEDTVNQTITGTWNFKTDMPARANAYLKESEDIGGSMTYSGGGESYFAVGTEGLVLADGETLTLSLPANVAADSTHVTINGEEVSKAISADGKTVTITGPQTITEIIVTYDVPVPQTGIYKAYLHMLVDHQEATKYNKAEKWYVKNYAETRTSSAYAGKNIFTIKDGNGNDVTYNLASGGQFNSNEKQKIDGVVDLYIKSGQNLSTGATIEFTVPSESGAVNSAELYLYGGTPDSSDPSPSIIMEDITGPNLSTYKEGGSTVKTVSGKVTNQLIFKELEPGHTYRITAKDNPFRFGAVALVAKRDGLPAFPTVTWIDQQEEDTKNARVLAYLPFNKGSFDFLSKITKYDDASISAANVHVQYEDVEDYSWHIFNGGAGSTQSTSNFKGDGIGKYFTLGKISTSSGNIDSKDTITFTVPGSGNKNNIWEGKAVSATLYVIASANENAARTLVLTDNNKTTSNTKTYNIDAGTASQARKIVYENLTAGNSYTLSADGTMKYTALILVLSDTAFSGTENPVWGGTRESNYKYTDGETKHIPFLWDYDPNYQTDDNGTWNRNIDWDSDGWRTNVARNAAPFNYGWVRRDGEQPGFSYPEAEVDAIYGTEEAEVHWGGDWSVPEEHKLTKKAYDAMVTSQGNNALVKGVNTYPVTVSGYEFDFENMHFPTNYGGHSMGSTDFSNQGFGSYNAAYSVGYFETIVPFDTDKSDSVTVRGYVRDFKADTLSGDTVTQDGIETGGAAVDKSNYDVDHDEDRAKTEISGSVGQTMSVLKYNSFMAKNATNINDKDITTAIREDLSKRDVTNNIKGQFLGDSASTNGQDWDASASVGDHIDIWGGFQLSAPDDNAVTAANLMQKFDSAVFEIDPSCEQEDADKRWDGGAEEGALIGRTWGSYMKTDPEGTGLLEPNVNLLWGIHSTINSTSGDNAFKTLKTADEDDFTWYDTYTEAKAKETADNKISAVMAEVRDAYIINGLYFSFRIPVKVKTDADVNETYATANRLETWAYVPGAKSQPMKGISWLKIDQADDYGNTYNQSGAKKNYFHITSDSSKNYNPISYYDETEEVNASRELKKSAHGYRVTTDDDITGKNDNNFVVTDYLKYIGDKKPVGHIGDVDASGNGLYNSYKQNRGEYKNSVTTAWTVGMGILITDYKSQVQIAVNNKGDSQIAGVEYYNKATGNAPEFRLKDIQTFTNRYEGENSADKTSLTVTADFTDISTGNKYGGVYFSGDSKPVIKFLTKDGTYSETTFEIPTDGTKVHVTIPSDAASGAGQTFYVSCKFNFDESTGNTAFINNRTVVFNYTEVPHMVNLGDIIIPTEMSLQAEPNSIVTAKTTITGEGDVRNFAEYSRNLDKVTIGISATSGSDNRKYVDVRDRLSEGEKYGENVFKTDHTNATANSELNQDILYTIVYSNATNDTAVQTINAYDVLDKVVQSDKGHLNVKAVKVFSSTLDDRGKGKGYPAYDVFFTNTENTDNLFAKTWGDPTQDADNSILTPPNGTGDNGGINITSMTHSNGGNDDDSTITFTKNEGLNQKAIYFKIGRDGDETPAVPAGRALNIQLVCEPVPTSTDNARSSLLAAEGVNVAADYANTAVFINSSGDTNTVVETDGARFAPVGRIISGVVWQDDDGNGRRASTNDNLVGKVRVALFRKNEDGTYTKVTKDILGNKLGNIEGATGNDEGVYVTSDERYLDDDNTKVNPNWGKYEFNNLPEGDYIVAFDVSGAIGDKVAVVSTHQPASGVSTNEDRRLNNTNDCVNIPESAAEFADYDFITRYDHTIDGDSDMTVISPVPLVTEAEVAATYSNNIQNMTNWDLGFALAGDPLPETGGMGTEGIKYAGLAIAAGAALMLMYDYTKKILRK